MQTVHTRIYKDVGGWKALTELDMEADRVLKIRTAKAPSGKLVTTASIWKIDPITDFLSHAMGFGTKCGDYQEQIMQSQPARVTVGVVANQHDLALVKLDAIKERALAHYATLPTGSGVKGGEHVLG